MKLSLQTVCIIFGVTLVHLIVIAAISPRGSEGLTLYGPAGIGDPDHGSAEERSDDFLIIEETAPSAAAGVGETAAPVDLPARHREDAGLTANPLQDPVASVRSTAAPPRS